MNKRPIEMMFAVACGMGLIGCAQKTAPTTAPAMSGEDGRAVTTEPRANADGVSSTDAERSITGSLGSELIGKRCRVRFRRDVLGVAGQAYVAPSADTAVPGQPLYVEGIVHSVSRNAVVLRGESDQLIWIPLGNVLMVESVK